MSVPAPIVYLVDDDGAVLRALTRVLASEGFATRTFTSPETFLTAHDPSVAGCAILDLVMPEMDGLAIQRRLAPTDAMAPRRIIFLTGEADVPTSVAAMKGGAVDFLTKPVDAEALLDAVRRAIELDLAARRRDTDDAGLRARFESLTPREREVLRHVVSGKLNKQIAAALGTTEKTIKVHRARVMQKMDAPSLADLVRFAGRLGIG